MSQFSVRYKVKPDLGDINEQYVKTVFGERRKKPSRQHTFKEFQAFTPRPFFRPLKKKEQ